MHLKTNQQSIRHPTLGTNCTILSFEDGSDRGLRGCAGTMTFLFRCKNRCALPDLYVTNFCDVSIFSDP